MHLRISDLKARRFEGTLWHMSIDCPCQRETTGTAIEDFRSLWAQCAALNKLFIPNLAEWEAALAALAGDGSGHASILKLAFERRCLHRLTLPVHKYLLDGAVPLPTLRKQYMKDLQERWFIRPEAEKRHQKSKGYLGRLAELLTVELASQSRRIVALEATGGDHDIETVTKDNLPEAIEVKFIGTEDSDFEKLTTMKIFGGPVDTPTAADYLLSRIYEAARQLSDFPNWRTVVIVIDEFISWNAFDAAIRNGTFNPHQPRFQSQNSKWLTFLDELKKHYPTIETDLAPTVLSLSEIRIFRLIADETLKEEFVFTL